MRLLQAWNAWRNRRAGAAASIPANPAIPASRGAASVPGEYSAFYAYLEHRYSTTVVLTFRDIEALLGFPLPNAARIDRDWWTGTLSGGADRHSEAWSAARRTARPNLPAQTVAFDRVS